jgi:ABC-type transporter Mla MlaB component
MTGHVDRESSEATRALPQLALRGSLDDRDLSALCRTLWPLYQLPAGSLLEVDLRDLIEIGPASLAVLVSTLRALRSRRICEPLEWFTAPDNGRLAAWLSRPALEQLLSGRAGRGERGGGGAPRPRGCEPFVDGEGIDRVVASIQMSLPENMDWVESDRASFGTLVSDITKNVLQHSDSDGVAVLRTNEGEPFVDLAIADAGVGIRSSLARNPDHQDVLDDVEAVRRAVGPSTTGDPGAGGGLGLYLARLVVEANGGRFVIRSGDASYEEQEMAQKLERTPRLQGTLILVRVRTDREFDYDRIDSWLERPGGMLG